MRYALPDKPAMKPAAYSGKQHIPEISNTWTAVSLKPLLNETSKAFPVVRAAALLNATCFYMPSYMSVVFVEYENR